MGDMVEMKGLSLIAAKSSLVDHCCRQPPPHRRLYSIPPLVPIHPFDVVIHVFTDSDDQDIPFYIPYFDQDAP